MKKVKSVQEYYDTTEKWSSELERLRRIALEAGLDECLKWSIPTYTINNINVVGIGGFKHHFCLWFFQGALLRDKESKLINAQEGKTRAMRQWRFDHADQIDPELIRSYLLEAKENARQGRKVSESKSASNKSVISKLLKDALAQSDDLFSRFEQLTPARQREYHEYIAEAKRDSTKHKRLQKSIGLIASGKGLNDQYRKC